MHHQQRMAAIGTDKELSDLLDFSAVSNCYNIAMTETKAPTYRRLCFLICMAIDRLMFFFWYSL
ncbi:unnamed protein product [Oncorhynchus mykiss]|uniref:Uncharacterized protein n=1 Tax=Oncorhynchus mykiss TaxID=8022 RepID=A0A060YYU5_ONCMY|nr:unnamed protein product [Oncorhynchus mykiss]